MSDDQASLARSQTYAVHGGEARRKPADAITDPIFCCSSFTFGSTQEVIDFVEERSVREEYARYGNPTERTAEAKLAALEGGEDAVLFASGMAAVTGFLLAKLRAGDEVVLFDECYHHIREFCVTHLERLGIGCRLVRMGDYAALEAALTPRTRLLISETPTNPYLSVLDLERWVALARKHGVETLLDATLATPFNIQPLAWGVDYVMHSATKYLAGHNDLLAGVVIGSRDKLKDVRTFRGVLGAVNSPHNAYLLVRGLKTFPLRMAQHNRNGQAVAEFLAGHPKVARVRYPGLPSDPGYTLAQATLRGGGGVVAVEVKGDWAAAARLVDAVTIPRIGPSLGGAESLIEQPRVLSFWKTPPEKRAALRIPDNMVRLALGIEDSADLIADLAQALERV